MTLPKISDYEFLEKLGSGSYATVYKACHKISKEISAIKCVEKSSLSVTAHDNIITEISLLKKLNHKYIVEMKDFFWDEKNIYIVMEFCNYGDLSKLIKKCGLLPEKTCRIFLRQLSSALQYMHINNVCHFDLKPQNLLLTKKPNVILKIADFGFAQYLKLGQENTSIKGSPLYMAPEILLKHSYSSTADLWSIGVILYECLFGKPPYSSENLTILLSKIKKKQVITIPKQPHISSECNHLLTNLLKHEPNDRITFDDYFKHEFLDLQHLPSDENLEKGIEIVKKAIIEDTKNNFKQAYYLYCDSLQYFVPIIIDEIDIHKKTELRKNVDKYIKRAEEIKYFVLDNSNTNQHNNDAQKQDSNLSKIENALTPNTIYQQLYKLSKSSPAIANALEIGRQGDLYNYENKLDICLDNYKMALNILVPLLNNEPSGLRKDLLHQQIMVWMQDAESIKSILLAKNLQNTTNDNTINDTHLCVLQ